MRQQNVLQTAEYVFGMCKYSRLPNKRIVPNERKGGNLFDCHRNRVEVHM